MSIRKVYLKLNLLKFQGKLHEFPISYLFKFIIHVFCVCLSHAIACSTAIIFDENKQNNCTR